MAENDLNNDQAITDPDLNNTDSVDQADLNNTDSVNQAQDDGKLADGTDANKDVPYAKLKAEADARKVAEEKAAFAQRELEILQQAQQLASQSQTQQAGSTFEQALIDLGLTAEDYYGDNIISVQNRKTQLDNALSQRQSAFSANQQFVSSHSDFSQVVGSVNPVTGQIVAWSQEALALQQKKPYLAGAFNTAQGAYDAIMDERRLVDLEKKAAVNQEHINRQGADIATKPLGGSAAGGPGSGDNSNQKLMSREEQLAIRAKLAAGETVS